MTNADFLIIGGGPTGLMAALSASEFGLEPLIIDENQTIGGQLIKQTHMFFGSKAERAGTRGFEIGLELEQEIAKRNIKIERQASAVGYYPDGTPACRPVRRSVSVGGSIFYLRIHQRAQPVVFCVGG